MGSSASRMRLGSILWIVVLTVEIFCGFKDDIYATPFALDTNEQSVLSDHSIANPDPSTQSPADGFATTSEGYPQTSEVVDANGGPATFLAPSANAGVSEPCYGQRGAEGSCEDPPGLFQFFGFYHRKWDACWRLRADSMVLWRSAPQPRPIFSHVSDDALIGATALDAQDLTSDVLAAPRLSLLRTDCNGRTIEATYFYAGNFYSDRSLPFVPDGYATSPPGIYGNEWGPPDTSLDSATAKLIGQLQSLEFNARHCIWPETCQFLIGTRWLQWNETLHMNDSFSYTEPEAISGKDVYETRCFNNLWGGQIGLDTLILGRACTSRVEGVVKAGAYYNNPGQSSTVRYVVNNSSPENYAAAAEGPATASFVGEVGLTAVMPISCNCDFRCGYFGLWLTNLAQPTRQLSNQIITQGGTVGGLDTAGVLMVQGLSLGLEGRW